MKKRKVIAILLLFVFIGLGIWVVKIFSAKHKKSEETYQTARVEHGSIQLVITCTGKVVSNQDVEIKSKASGKIISLPFDISDWVQASSLLVELDPTDEQRNVERALAALEATQARLNSAIHDVTIAENKLKTARMNIQAELSSSKAAWEDAENKANREEQLYQKKLSSQEDLDTQKTEAIKTRSAYEKAIIKKEELKTQEMELELKRQQVQLEESQVRAAMIDLEIANQRLNDTKILAPIDGIVTAKNVQIGQIISSGINNVSGGTTIMTLSDLSRIFVTASVDESDIGKIQLDQKTEITVDSYPDTTFTGKVVQVASRGVNVSNVVTFDVRIEISGENKSLLKPEMTANVRIITMEKPDVLFIPEEAIEFSTTSDPRINLLLPDQGIDSRTIKVGLDNGRIVEVVEGLKEGEEVILNSKQIHSEWSNAGKPKDSGER